MNKSLLELAQEADELIDAVSNKLKETTHTFFTPEEIKEGDPLFDGTKVHLLDDKGFFTEYAVVKIDQGQVFLEGIGEYQGEQKETDFSNLTTDNLLEMAVSVPDA